MEQQIRVGQREAALVMSRRVPATLSSIGAIIGGSFGEAYGYIGARDVEPQGPPFVIYHGIPDGERPFDIELCAPIGHATDAAAGWQIQELPSGLFATIVHVGPYDTLPASYAALATWIGDHGMTPAGPPREVYLSPPETPPELVRTVIEIPVAQVSKPVPAR